MEKKRWVISDRKNFNHTHEFSSKTFIEEHPYSTRISDLFNFNPTNRREYTEEEAKNFYGRDVLVYTHGFTVKLAAGLGLLGKIAKKLQKKYDDIILYTYPACKEIDEYRQAKKNGMRAAKERLSKVLDSIALANPNRLDIIAHSLGTIVAMHAVDAMRAIDRGPPINSLHLVGGAVPEKSLFKDASPLERALSNAKKIYVLYSCKDKVLPWLSLYLSPRPAGRLNKDVKGLVFAENVCLINATPVVLGHSCYFEREEVFKFFRLVAQEGSLKGFYFSMGTKELSVLEPEGCAAGVKEAIAEGVLIAEEATKKKFMKLKVWRKLTIKGPTNKSSSHRNT